MESISAAEHNPPQTFNLLPFILHFPSARQLEDVSLLLNQSAKHTSIMLNY